MTSSLSVILCLILLLLSSSCGKKQDDGLYEKLPRPAGTPLQIKVPLGLPPLPIPPGNPPTTASVALGRKLFYDTHLSSDNKLSCASCHNPALGFVDGLQVSRGVGGALGTRNALTILNAAYSPADFWDGRAASLEDQAGGPMENPLEMNQPHTVSVAKLNAIPAYRKEFQDAFGAGPVTLDKIRFALASFERTLLSGNSPFDRYQYGGEKKALSPAAIRGLALFTDTKRANCVTCHTIGPKYALFTDGKFHNIGVSVNSEGELTDLGRYKFTHVDSDKGAFRTPTLRNIAETAPYMHDGSKKTLKEVIEFYVGGGNSNPQLDKEIRSFSLSARERSDLIEFLKSLTGEPPPGAVSPSSE